MHLRTISSNPFSVGKWNNSMRTPMLPEQLLGVPPANSREENCYTLRFKGAQWQWTGKPVLCSHTQKGAQWQWTVKPVLCSHTKKTVTPNLFFSFISPARFVISYRLKNSVINFVQIIHSKCLQLPRMCAIWRSSIVLHRQPVQNTTKHNRHHQ